MAKRKYIMENAPSVNVIGSGSSVYGAQGPTTGGTSTTQSKKFNFDFAEVLKERFNGDYDINGAAYGLDCSFTG